MIDKNTEPSSVSDSSKASEVSGSTEARQSWQASSPPPFSTEASERRNEQPTVAFCQQCGRGLTSGTVHAVGSGIFCQPCATAQAFSSTGNAPGASSAGYAPVQDPSGSRAAAPPRVPGEPNPVLAGFLGLIPGVGAMYNGQYPKGVIHLVIFVVLTSLADNLNWVLWWFVWGWIFYQAFEAYHTAQARRDGMPLPDPFGWNDLGDRLGLSRTSPPVAPAARSAPRPSSVAYGAAQAASRASEASNFSGASGFSPYPVPTVPPTEAPFHPEPDAFPTGTSWSAPVSAHDARAASSASAEAAHSPTYTATYTGMPNHQTAPTAAPVALPPRFPVGAAWLIGLGVLFLIGNLAPAWRLDARWLVPALLAFVALWIGGRKVQAALNGRAASTTNGIAPLAESLVGPVILLTVAVLLALQNADIVPLRHSWPTVLIVWGAFLLVGRAGSAALPPPSLGTQPAPETFPPDGTPPL